MSDAPSLDALAAAARGMLNGACTCPTYAAWSPGCARSDCPCHGEHVPRAPDLARALVAAVDALRAEREARATAEASVAQLRADLERADFDRQRVEGERDAIAEAAGGFVAAADAHESEATRWQREYIPNHTAHAVVIVAARDAADAARTRLDALLSGCAADVVRAGVVRDFLAALDAGADVAMRGAGTYRAALDAALAAAEGR